MTRLSRRIRGWVTLLAFAGSFGLPFVSARHLAADDDAACGQTSVFSGHPTTQVEDVKPAIPLAHCPFCHWQRAVSGIAPAAMTAVVAWLEPVEPSPSASPRFSGTTAVSARQSRAPPSHT